MEGRMSGYDTDDILSQALDLAEKGIHSFRYNAILSRVTQALGARTPSFCALKKKSLFFYQERAINLPQLHYY
jgi:hypothetical protein